MSSEDLPLTIPLANIVDFFNCPVCMSTMKETMTTECGHRYCGNCIKECVGRHHKCPCCNNQLTLGKLMKDPQFDDLINTVEREKTKSETQYFNTLINTAAQQTSSGDDTVFSPVELVLRKHMTKALAAHEKYYQELKRQYDRRMTQVEQEFRSMKEELFTLSLCQEEWDRQMDHLNGSKTQQREQLTEELTACSQLVADAYDRYLTEHIPDIGVLPIRVTLNLMHKNSSFSNVEIRPNHTMEDIQKIFERQISNRGDEIVGYSDEVRFVCFRTLCKHSQYEMHQLARDVVEHQASHPDIFILPPKCRPLLQFALKPGCTIALYGQVQFMSDMPKQCFATTFRKGEIYDVDYFSCKDCNFNWVCRPCMEVCHRDHNTVPYIMNHHPTWACCYCPKKKKCVISS